MEGSDFDKIHALTCICLSTMFCIGAFMMLARKWDRIENQVSSDNYDIFKTISNDPSKDGILDDIRDLRRYLLLVESHCSKKVL